MLRGMAIRMKEWGMLAYPRQSVHLTVNSLNDWGRSGQALGQGIAAAGRGAAELAGAMERVSFTGNEADIAERLDTIGREVADELQEKPVRDWDYSWQQAYAPRLHQLLTELDDDARVQAERMSPAYSRQHSLQARRAVEVERIRRARRKWQEQVEHAVQQGDTASARRWLEQGKQVFVPEFRLPQKLDEVESRSLSARWQLQLQQDPAAALAAWNEPDAARPTRQEDMQQLQNCMEQARRELESRLALQLSAAVEQGLAPDAETLQQAAAAGVIPQHLLEASRQEPRPLGVADSCNWLHRIDERDTGGDDRLVVEIALAPVPADERRLLLQRVQSTAALPVQQRAGISRRLRAMYQEGHFGCPGDTAALRCLGRLLDEALQRQLSGAGEKEIRVWLDTLQQGDDHWLCYSPEPLT